MHIIAVITLYLIFVLEVGPAMMKNRPAMNLDWFMQYYNLINIIANTFIFAMSFYYSNFTIDAFTCSKSFPMTPRLILGFGYTYLKVDFLEHHLIKRNL